MDGSVEIDIDEILGLEARRLAFREPFFGDGVITGVEGFREGQL